MTALVLHCFTLRPRLKERARYCPEDQAGALRNPLQTSGPGSWLSGASKTSRADFLEAVNHSTSAFTCKEGEQAELLPPICNLDDKWYRDLQIDHRVRDTRFSH